MKDKKPKPVQHFPVMDGAGPAPRADQIAGIVQRVWAESRVYHEDVETLLREWLGVEGCIVRDEEFALLLDKARTEFTRLAAHSEADEAPHCAAHDLVECLYWDVQRLERIQPGAPETA
ncbi:hypothetical protein G3T36_18165 [Diaminobutyricibacter tongyongensis]|uniref:Uncharacterized protein n=1 Tax=Leifsonia tongyongensis TaxID=1268043 RepID=A0A6L9Y2N9_9MICO|nr:hypothetical protein [Diaminobutyricibacter tongyongensis]NEN07785.1 hypothetical protein [Diaminobutyricibacter tongyongensis]